MVKSINIEQVIHSSAFDVLIDVRSPSEFRHAHIPGAINVPIFTDEQRAEIGTTYKQISRQQAIKIGLQYFGPKMKEFVEFLENEIRKKHSISFETVLDAHAYNIILYCWRGGMRSGAMAWLMDTYGFNTSVINGGYKTFRKWVSEQFSKTYDLRIVAGNTGSNKTHLLHTKQLEGASIIDLERIANHKGSAFGHIGMPDQPSQEMFENTLAYELTAQKENIIWAEDECRRLGHVYIPTPFWLQMQSAIKIDVTLPFDVRLNNILVQYGNLPREELKLAVMRIQKKLGGAACKNVIDLLDNNNTKEAFIILLKYYDKAYQSKAIEKFNQENPKSPLQNDL